MKLLIIFTTFLLTFLPAVKARTPRSSGEKRVSNCTKKNETLVVYDGWPQIIECLNEDEYDDISDADEPWEWVNCNITFTSNGTTVKSIRFLSDEETPFCKTPDLAFNSSLSYTVYIWNDGGSDCKSKVVTFRVIPMPNDTCAEAMEGGREGRLEDNAGSTTKLDCTSSDDVYKVRPEMVDNFTVDWFYNCNTLPPGVAVKKTKHEFDAANIAPISFQHPGVYSCAVTYKGMTLHMARRYRICVKEKITTSAPTIKCPKSSYLVKKLGGNVTVECTVDLGFGAINEEITSRWVKYTTKDKAALDQVQQSGFECITDAIGTVKQPVEPVLSKHRCYRNAAEMDKPCYTQPTNNISRTPLVFKLRLYLVDIQKADLGLYKVTFKTHHLATYDVSIEMDETPEVKVQIMTIALGVGLGLLVLLILLLLVVFHFYVAVCWKICFGKYVDDDKLYDAFISYHFSTELDAFAQQQSRDLCAAVCNQLESLQFTIYDEHRNGSDEYRAEKVISMMEQCHRVVVLLSAAYVKDHWNVFQLQQGFKSMIESGSKVIFVLVPGIKEYVKQQAAYDDTCRMIQRALELNTTISWSPKKQRRRRFALELGHGMPKLKRGVLEKKKSKSSPGSDHCTYASEKSCPITV